MKCPACTNQLSARMVAGVTLDVCDNGCGGIWFDKFEFKKFDERKEPDAETILNLKITTKPVHNADERLNCPKCANVKLMRHFSSIRRKVTIDECAMCAGIWLDAGELHDIRDEYESETDRREAAEKLFSQMFDDRIKEAKAKSTSEVHNAQAFAGALRFLCPSYYIKGKQNGGAF